MKNHPNKKKYKPNKKKYKLNQIVYEAQKVGLSKKQIYRIVLSYKKSKSSNRTRNTLTKINKFKASNKGIQRIKWLRNSPFAIYVLNKHLNKLNKIQEGLKEAGIVDKSFQRYYNKIFNQYLWVKELRAPTRQLKEERKNQREHWVGLARANINLKKPQMTVFRISNVGKSMLQLEQYLREKLNDYKSDISTLINKGLTEGLIQHLQQYYETGVIYGYITNENEVFSPV